MLGATLVLVAFGLSLTFAAGPLFDYAGRAAETLRARTPYIDAVLGAAQDHGPTPPAGGLAQGAGGVKRSGAPVDQIGRDVGRIAVRLNGAAQFGFEGGGLSS